MHNKLEDWLKRYTTLVEDSREVLSAREYSVMMGKLINIRASIDSGDAEATAKYLIGFYTHIIRYIGEPEFEQQGRKNSSKNAIEQRYEKKWTPDQRAALKLEYKQCIDKFEHPTTHYKHLAQRILKDKNKWRQIKRIIEKPSK